MEVTKQNVLHLVETPNGIVHTPSEFLATYRLFASGHLLVENSIISIGTKAPVTDALRTLSAHHILSMPVIDESTGRVVGLIDLVDIVHLAISELEAARAAKLTDLAAVGASDALLGTVADAAETSLLNPLVTVKNGVALSAVIRGMGAHSLRRLVVTDADDDLSGIVSQSWLIRWVNTHKAALGPEMLSSIEELGLVAGPECVIAVRDSEPAAAAFEAMVAHGISTCGVMNDEGVICGVVTVSDLKILIDEETGNLTVVPLFQPVLDFIAMTRARNLRTFPAVVTLAPTSTLAHAIERLATTRLHALFVVDVEGHPLGVVTIGDVLRRLPSDFETN